MNNKFDELTKSMAQSVTRRAALKKFGVGLAGMALAAVGLANKAVAANGHAKYCQVAGAYGSSWFTGQCVDINTCVSYASTKCPAFGTPPDRNKLQGACGLGYATNKPCT